MLRPPCWASPNKPLQADAAEQRQGQVQQLPLTEE